MRKSLVSILGGLAVILLALSGCAQHEHTWVAATCTAPKTCSECGATEGSALEHTWVAATCAAPKTCSECGATEGSALEHTWEKATCTAPMTCSVCGATSGEALGHEITGLTCTQDGMCARCGETVKATGHQFSDATCTQPKVCRVCGETEGEPLGHTCTTGVCARCGLESYETVYGSGDDVVTDIAVGDGLYRVHFTHSGRRNFIVKAYDAEHERDLLVNEIGRYDGYVLLSGDSPYSFEIDADGAWSYKVERLTEISAASFSGRGDYVTGLSSTAQSGVWKFTHNGDSNFIVRIYTTEGRDSLVNEIGRYEGKKMVEIPNDSNAMFEITADGDWTIAPEE